MDIVLLFIGAIFLLAGTLLFWQQLQALLYFKKVPGKVIALEKRGTPASGSKKEGGPMFYPIIEYIARGNIKTFTGSMGSGSPIYRIGEEVSVLYSRKKDEARLKSMIPLVMGSIFAGVGVLMFVIFINVFTFSYFSMAATGAMGIFILVQIRKGLKKRDISSFDELKESFRNTNMKTRKGIAPEHKELITTNDQLQKVEAKSAEKLKFVGPLFTVIGLGVLALGIYLGKERADFLDTALSAKGQVIDLNERRSDDSYVYYPVVEFNLPGTDQVFTFEHDSGSNPPSYSVGEEVTVLYAPDSPGTAIIDAGILNYMGAGIASLLGLIFSVVGIASSRKHLKYRKSMHP